MTRFRLVIAFGLAVVLCPSCSPRDPVRPYPGEPAPPFRPAIDVYPVWSHNGAWIAYLRRFPSSDGPAGVYIIDAAGGIPRFLAPGGFSFPGHLRFSPDDRYISGQMGDQLVLIDLVTGAVWQPFYSEYGAADAGWSPDSRTIMYRRFWYPSSAPPESLGLRFHNLETGRDTAFYFEGSVVPNGASPLWSPDGREIAVTQGSFDQRWITVFRADGTAARRIAESPPGLGLSGLRLYTRRSQGVDGIAFAGAVAGFGSGFFVINWDGSGLSRIPNDRLQGEFSWFSPDGEQVVLPSFDPTDTLTVLFVFDSDDVTGATARQLTRYLPPPGQQTSLKAPPVALQERR